MNTLTDSDTVQDLWEHIQHGERYPWVVSIVLNQDGKPDAYGHRGYCQPVNLADGKRLDKWFFWQIDTKGLGSLLNSMRYARDDIRFELDKD